MDSLYLTIAQSRGFNKEETELFLKKVKSGETMGRAVDSILKQRVVDTALPVEKPRIINSGANKGVLSGRSDQEKIWNYLLSQKEGKCSREIASEAHVPEDIVFKRISEFKAAGLVKESGKSVYKNRKGGDTTLSNYIATTSESFLKIENELEEAKEFTKLRKHAKPMIDTFKELSDILLDRKIDHFERAELFNEFYSAVISFIEHNPQTTDIKKQKRINEKGLIKTLELQQKIRNK